MNSIQWEHFEHEADIGVRGFGHTPAQAFEQAALAMTAVICDTGSIEAVTAVDIDCRENDYDTLLYDWLNTLVFEMATRKMLFSEFDVTIDHGHLQATIRGEAIDRRHHQPAVEIKGATYTELAVYQEQDQWVAQCVVDV